MSSLLSTIRELFGPPDPRSEREIEDDIDAEFAFHIEQIERELIEHGVPTEQAAGLAHARFGNHVKLKQRCKSIALEDRIMLQRINTVLMIIVMFAVIGVSIQMSVTQRYNSLALQDITTQIAKMRIDARLEAREWAANPAAATTQPASAAGVVYLEGDVERPGTYSMPDVTDLTVRRLLAGAGGVPDETFIELVRMTPDGQSRRPIGLLSELKRSAERDVVLQAGDLVTVTHVERPRPQRPAPEDRFHVDRTRLQPGKWRQIDEAGQTIEKGAILYLQSNRYHTDNMRRIGTTLTARLDLGVADLSLDLEFRHEGQLHVRSARNEQERLDGRWSFDADGALVLNVPNVDHDLSQPIRLLHEDQMHQR